MLVGALIACLLVSFLLSALESAIFSVSVVRVRHRSKEAGGRRRKEARLERVFLHRERLLISILLTNNALALVAFALATRLLVGRFGDSGYWIAFLVSLPVYIFWCELVPKSLFLRFPYRALRFFVLVLEIIDLTVGQLLGLLFLLKPIFQEEGERESDEIDDRERARAEFRSLAKIVARDGELAPAEREMIENVMNFGRTLAADLMVPIADVTAIPLDMPADQVVRLAKETGLDEFPVMSKTGELIGIVSSFEILRDRSKDARAVNYLRRLIKVDQRESATSLLLRLRKAGLQVAAICSDDATKKPLGIVAVDDIFNRMLQQA